MSINIRKFKRELKDQLSGLDIEFQYEDREKVVAKLSVGAQNYFDDHILYSITLSKKGYLLLYFTFDKVIENIKAYRLINDFNENTQLKGYLTNSDGALYFQISAHNFNIRSNNEALTYIHVTMDEMLSSHTLNYLVPITKITI